MTGAAGRDRIAGIARRAGRVGDPVAQQLIGQAEVLNVVQHALIDRVRAGITFRYIPTEVKCDLGVWPNFEVYPCRGVNEFQHNPIGKIPTENGNPTSFNQLSSDFK